MRAINTTAIDTLQSAPQDPFATRELGVRRQMEPWPPFPVDSISAWEGEGAGGCCQLRRESRLTSGVTFAGESVSVLKHCDAIPDPRAVNQDKKNVLFSVSDCFTIGVWASCLLYFFFHC